MEARPPAAQPRVGPGGTGRDATGRARNGRAGMEGRPEGGGTLKRVRPCRALVSGGDAAAGTSPSVGCGEPRAAVGAAPLTLGLVAWGYAGSSPVPREASASCL